MNIYTLVLLYISISTMKCTLVTAYFACYQIFTYSGYMTKKPIWTVTNSHIIS